jgi:hypothetical protein
LYILLLLGLPSRHFAGNYTKPSLITRYIQHVSLQQCRPKSNETQIVSFNVLSNSLLLLIVPSFDSMWSELLAVSFNK